MLLDSTKIKLGHPQGGSKCRWGRFKLAAFDIQLKNCTRCIQQQQQQRLFNSFVSGTTKLSRYLKGKTNLDLLKQETVSDSGISWAIYKTAPYLRQITMPAPTTRFFYSPDE